ncbi:Subunit 17 of Mediator complex [Nakaseomyces glabratus]|nr:Subunit 17 of Mediator complex [Nakaseomyces glabratus]KAH7590440.1 Subunit 17 of Mediator complex [Nakaseomyces glabratus]KAI8396150.1 Subunit 17 of Mediator complex [Nakaseomyces glabratus]
MTQLTENTDELHSIRLAIDPNLITLPIGSKSTSPHSNSTSDGNPESHNTENEEVDNKAGSLPPEQLSNNSAKLIVNPYEKYGRMSLGQLIPLISQQRGPNFKFADINEDILKQELAIENDNGKQESKDDTKAEDGIDTMDIDQNDNSEVNTNDIGYNEWSNEPKEDTGILDNTQDTNINGEMESQLTQEEFNKIRKVMLEHINMAMNESSLAMEFVSLLLSPVRESTAVSSMSPFLKKTVNPGSLNSEKVKMPAVSRRDKLSLSILSRGWKLRALNEARAILKKNFTEISSSLKQEHHYWSSIAYNISNKDVLFKIRDKQTTKRSLGLKYGYEDSGSTFRNDRGTAILRGTDEANGLELIPLTLGRTSTVGSVYKGGKFLRVRIFTKIESEGDYILSGESSLDKLFKNHSENSDSKNDDVRLQISKLKFFIFEQELMHQLKKECAYLISYGVTVENEHKIVIELPNEKFEIEYLSLDDDSVVNHEQDAPKANDRRANLMLVTLRMLLIVIYKKNLRQKMVSNTRKHIASTEKDILLIRPLLGKMRHSNHKKLIRKILKECVLEVVPDTELQERSIQSLDKEDFETFDLQDAHIVKLTKDINAFRNVLDVGKTEFTIDMKQSGKLSLILESPNYCNAQVSIKYDNQTSNTHFNTVSTEFKEVEEFLHFLISTYVNPE